MITAIINQIKTGAITNVWAKFDGKVNLVPPYVLVWEAPRISFGNAQAVGGFYVSYHTVIGKQDDIDNYMNGTIVGLLHKVILTDSQSNNFRLEDSNDLSVLVDNNDDNTISKDRLFLLPKLGAF